MKLRECCKLVIGNAISLLLFALLLCSCEKEDLIEGEDVSAWLHREMKANYLWLDEIGPYSQYNPNAEPQQFFSSLISQNEIKTADNGQKYWYSYIENVSKTKSDAGSVGYGIDFILYKSQDGSQYYARVKYVEHGSPAEREGIRRGMWVVRADNQALTLNNYTLLQSGNGVELKIYDGPLPIQENQLKIVELPQAEVLDENPVYKTAIIETSRGKLGYLMYNHFSTGPNGFSDKTWDNALIAAAIGLKNEGVKSLILDLRYNLGGYIDCAMLLSSIVAREQDLGKYFCKTTYHPKSSYTSLSYYLRKSPFQANLDITHLYVLMGEFTASASELVINGLEPFENTDMTLIGTVTEGKNLGSREIQSNSTSWVMHPIVAYIQNSAGFGNYAEGLSPDVYLDEFDTRKVPVWGELGTPDDALTQMAISLYTGESVPILQKGSPGQMNVSYEPVKINKGKTYDSVWIK